MKHLVEYLVILLAILGAAFNFIDTDLAALFLMLPAGAGVGAAVWIIKND